MPQSKFNSSKINASRRAALTGLSISVPLLFRHSLVGAAASPASDKKLIVIMLRGAMDGLSAIVPHGENNYYQQRSSIAIAKPGEADGAIALNNLFALNPGMASLKPFWDQGSFSFIHASGSHDTTRSHFDAQDYIETATPGRKATQDGWMNRLLTVLQTQSGQSEASKKSNLRAISMGPLLPRIYSGNASVASIEASNVAGRPAALDNAQASSAFAKLYQSEEASNSAMNRAMNSAFKDATATRSQIKEANQRPDPMAIAAEPNSIEGVANQANNGALSLNSFSQDAQRLGLLMRRDATIQMAFLALGGWDTHVAQGNGNGKGQLTNKLSQLSNGLATLAQSLGEQFARTNIMVVSEFGRTVKQNGTNGTDHGHGNVTLLLGGNIAGGKSYGQWPGLDSAALYENRDLAITTDFRGIIAQMLQGHLQLNESELAAVLPNMPSSANMREKFLRF